MSDTTLRAAVSAAEAAGWQLEEVVDESRAVLRRPNYGTVEMHIAIGVLTFWTLGLCNALYAYSQYKLRSPVWALRVTRPSDTPDHRCNSGNSAPKSRHCGPTAGHSRDRSATVGDDGNAKLRRKAHSSRRLLVHLLVVGTRQLRVRALLSPRHMPRTDSSSRFGRYLTLHEISEYQRRLAGLRRRIAHLREETGCESRAASLYRHTTN